MTQGLAPNGAGPLLSVNPQGKEDGQRLEAVLLLNHRSDLIHHDPLESKLFSSTWLKRGGSADAGELHELTAAGAMDQSQVWRRGILLLVVPRQSLLPDLDSTKQCGSEQGY